MTEQELKLLREKLVRHKRYLKDSDDPSGGSIMLFDYITDVQVLLSHIDHLETIIGDRMEEAAFLIAAGAAEGRVMVMAWMRETIANLGREGSVVPPKQRADLECALNVFLGSMEKQPFDLLPPSEARLEAERLRVENEALRKKVDDLQGELEDVKMEYRHEQAERASMSGD